MITLHPLLRTALLVLRRPAGIPPDVPYHWTGTGQVLAWATGVPLSQGAHVAGRDVVLFLIAAGLLQPVYRIGPGVAPGRPGVNLDEYRPLEGSPEDILKEVDRYLREVTNQGTDPLPEMFFQTTELGMAVVEAGRPIIEYWASHPDSEPPDPPD